MTHTLGQIFRSWPCQNAIVALLLVGTIVFLWRLSRREYWRLAARELRSRKGAMVCAAILSLYAVVAVLDSVGWRSPAIDPTTGNIIRVNGRVVLDEGRSVLDRLLKPLADRREKTYSAPLGTVQFTKSTVKGRDGRIQRTNEPLAHPRSHLLGTDMIGQDVLLQSLKSIRTGLIIGLLTTLLAVPFALLFGLCGGYYGGWVDDAVQYVCTVLSSIPNVLLIAALMVVWGQGLPQLCVAMGIASWTGLCRLLRGETMRLREADFVSAATAQGVPGWKILLRHILPNVLHIVLINLVLRFSSEVLAEAALTYLGMGVGADTMSWGTMINDARTELTRNPVIWWKLCAAFAFMLGLVLPANIFGDAVRDALDPRMRTQ